MGTVGKLSGHVVAWQRDRASVNNAAVSILILSYRGALDLHCLPHTLCHVGEHMPAPLALKLKQDLCKLNGLSLKSRKLWKEALQRAWKKVGNTRWWAAWELHAWVHEEFELFLLFTAMTDIPMTGEDDVGGALDGACITRIRTVVNTPATRILLQLQLGTLRRCCDLLIRTTYNLEGDGPLVLVAHGMIDRLDKMFDAGFDNMDFDGMADVINTYADDMHQADNASTVEQYRAAGVELAKAIVLPGKDYFNLTVMGKLADDIAVYKFCRLLNPLHARDHHVFSDVGVDTFRSGMKRYFGQLTAEQQAAAVVCFRSNYKALTRTTELPRLESDGKSDKESLKITLDRLLAFWQGSLITSSAVLDLKPLHLLVRMVLAIAPSSAASERVFSIYNALFSALQSTAYVDTVRTAVMLSFNRADDDAAAV